MKSTRNMPELKVCWIAAEGENDRKLLFFAFIKCVSSRHIITTLIILRACFCLCNPIFCTSLNHADWWHKQNVVIFFNHRSFVRGSSSYNLTRGTRYRKICYRFWLGLSCTVWQVTILKDCCNRRHVKVTVLYLGILLSDYSYLLESMRAVC